MGIVGLATHTSGLRRRGRSKVRRSAMLLAPTALVLAVILLVGPAPIVREGPFALNPGVPAQSVLELPLVISARGAESSTLAQPSSSQCGFEGSPYGPSGAVYDYARDEVFVADSETNAVYVISSANQTLEKVISLGNECVNPFGLAYDASLGDVFVAETGNGTVAAISDTSDSVVATFPVFGGPWNIAYDSGLDRLFVTDLAQGNITVLSLPTGRVVQTISEGRVEQPLGLAYAAGLGEVFVANSLGNYSSTMSVISDSSDTLVSYVPVHCFGPGSSGTLGEIPYGVAYDTRTGNVYVSCEGGSGLAVIATSNNTQVGYVPLNDETTAITYDADYGEVWAVAPFSGQVYSVSGETNLVVHQGQSGGFPFEGIAIDNRTGDVYVTNFRQTNVTVFDANASPIASITLPTPSTPPTPAFPSLNILGWSLVLCVAAGLGGFVVVLWIRVRKPPSVSPRIA